MSENRHGHTHADDHAGHSVTADTSKGRLLIALALIIGFMVFEVVAGILAHSLALISDSARTC